MHFLVTATSSLISNHNRKKTLNKIKKVNADSKGIVDLGHVDADSLIAEKEMIANICITGGSEKVRNSLLLQNCKQSLSNGIPVIVIHENNYCLAYDIKHAFQGNC